MFLHFKVFSLSLCCEDVYSQTFEIFRSIGLKDEAYNKSRFVKTPKLVFLKLVFLFKTL